MLQKVGLPYAQLCPTLCDPMDCSPPGSSVHGILQARTLELVAMPSSRGASPSRVEHASSVSSALQADSSPSESSGKALKRLVLPEPREDPSKRFHSVRPHSTGAAHGAASGREGRGAWGIRETSAPTTPPAYWGHRTADPSLNTFSLSLTTQAQALLTLIAPN